MMEGLFQPFHLLIIAGVVCIFLFVLLPIINYAIGARDAAAKTTRGARLKKAGILFLLLIAAGIVQTTGGPQWPEYMETFIDAVVTTFLIGAIVFLVQALRQRRD
jgi:peptidoglycan/LPS O-acetylase OafA/YrhL